MLKPITLLLGTLLAIQCAKALPTPENSPVPFTDLGQLVANAGETYVDFFGYATEMYRQLFEKVLELSHKDAETDTELKTALKPFVDYVNQMHEIKDKTREVQQNLFEESTRLADQYDRGVPVDASQADKKIAKYMNDVQAMKTKFEILMKYVNSLQQFANNVRKYLKSLPEEERENQKKLQMWYVNWQREHDWEKKNDLMLRFFELLDNSKDDRTKLGEKAVRNTLLYLNAVVLARKGLFRKVAKAIETEFKNLDDVKFELDIFKGFVERADNLHELSGENGLSELMRLFAASQEVKNRFKSTDLNENEKKIAEIMQKNGEMDVEVREVLLTFGLSEELTKEVEEYLDTRHKEDQAKEDLLQNWFEHVQEETDLDKRVDVLLGLVSVLENH